MSSTSRYVIDAWAWVEYLDGTKKGAAIENYLKKDEVFTCLVTVAEVISKAHRKGMDSNEALSAISSLSRIAGLNALSAKETGVLHAAMKKSRPNFSLGDAFVLHTAKSLHCKVLTGDPDFNGLKEAMLIKY
jgi:predicted nucleic acid-binding protein